MMARTLARVFEIPALGLVRARPQGGNQSLQKALYVRVELPRPNFLLFMFPSPSAFPDLFGVSNWREGAERSKSFSRARQKQQDASSCWGVRGLQTFMRSMGYFADTLHG